MLRKRMGKGDIKEPLSSIFVNLKYKSLLVLLLLSILLNSGFVAFATTVETTISGTISINTPAPIGGLELTVYIGFDNRPSTRITQAIEWPIYANEHYFDYDINQLYGISFYETKQYIIPEGETSVQYSISNPNGKVYVGAYISSGNYAGGSRIWFVPSYHNNGTVNMSLTYIETQTISGSITLPFNDDVGCTVVAVGFSSLNETADYYLTEHYSFNNTNAIEYSLKLRPYSSYLIEVFFDNGEYLKMTSSHTTGWEEIVENSPNFTAQASNLVCGNLSLPDGIPSAAKDIAIDMFLIRSDRDMNYVSTWKTVIIPAENRNIQFALYDDRPDGNRIELALYYQVRQPISGINGIFSFGFAKSYNTVTSNKADHMAFYSSEEKSFSLELLKSNNVSGTFSNPYAGNSTEVVFFAVDEELTNLGKYRVMESSGNMYEFNYEACLPDDCRQYLFAVILHERNIILFFSSDGFTEDKEDAFIIPISNDEANFDISFTGYNPPYPLEILDIQLGNRHVYDNGYDDGIYINVKSNSDLAQESVNVFLCYYDISGRLIGIEKQSLEPLELNALVYHPNYKMLLRSMDGAYWEKATTVKIYAWNNNLEPLIQMPYIMWNTALNRIDNPDYYEFSDVSDDVKYHDTFGRVCNLGIMYSYEDGTFKPELNIMRNEFSAIICRLFDSSEVWRGKLKFITNCEDVLQTNWDYNYVGLCVKKGLFEFENGYFRPNDYITVNEALSALICIFDKTDYECSIIDKAEELRLLNGVSEIYGDAPVNRGLCAQLIYNAYLKGLGILWL